MPTYHRPPSGLPSTMGQARPNQTIWTGASWDRVLDVRTDDARADQVIIVRRTPGGHCFTTPYQRGRATTIRIPTT